MNENSSDSESSNFDFIYSRYFKIKGVPTGSLQPVKIIKIEKKPTVCARCKKQCFNESELNKHIFLNHLKKIECVVCTLAYKGLHAYSRHMSCQHSCKVCLTCGASCETTDKWRIHICSGSLN